MYSLLVNYNLFYVPLWLFIENKKASHLAFDGGQAHLQESPSILSLAWNILPRPDLDLQRTALPMCLSLQDRQLFS